MTMDTEASLREYLKLQLHDPRRRADRAAGQGLRLRGHGGARGPGDPHRGQALLRGPRAATTTWWWSTPRPRDTSSGSWPPPRPSTSWSRWDSSARRPTGCSRSSPTRPRPGWWPCARPRRCRSSETIELAVRVREETTVQLSAVVVNRVLPELFGRQEEVVFDALSAPAALGRAGRAGRAATPPRCSMRPDWPSPCAAPAPPTSSGCAPGIDDSVPLLYLPYLFTRSHGLRTTRQVAASLGEELGLLTARRRPAPDRQPGRGHGDPQARSTACWPPRRSSSPADREAWARRPPPPPPASWPPSATAQGPRAHRRPGQAAGQRPRPRRHRQHRAPGARRGLPGRRHQAPGPAVGGHARHQGVVGRAHPPARTRRRRPATRSWPIRSTRTSPAASSRATTTSPWSASTRSTPRATTTSSWWTRRRPGTPSTSSTPPSGWPTSSRPACSGG